MSEETTNDKKSSNTPFNPTEHLLNLAKPGKPAQYYLPVQWRLVWFREKYPHGTIDTEAEVIDLDREVEMESFEWDSEKRRSEKVVKRAKGYARYRAVVTDGMGGRATGTKTETAVSFPDYAEKAETGAIGRALAALGYGTQFAPDLEEGTERIVDAPVSRSTSTAPSHDVSTTSHSPEKKFAGSPAQRERLVKSGLTAEEIDGMTEYPKMSRAVNEAFRTGSTRETILAKYQEAPKATPRSAESRW